MQTLIDIHTLFAKLKGINYAWLTGAIGIVTTVLDSVFGRGKIIKVLWLVIKRAGGYVGSHFALPRKVKQIEVDITQIKKEVTYNGGLSMKDSIRELTAMTGELLIISKAREEWDDKMIFRLNEKGECTSINRAFLTHFKWLERDVLGKNWENIIKASDLPQVQEKIERAIESKADYRDEHYILTSEHDSELCRVQASPIIHEGLLRGFLGTIQIIK
jgi:PAS domain S-box-containing protein